MNDSPSATDGGGAAEFADALSLVWRTATHASRNHTGLPTLAPSQAEALHHLAVKGAITPTVLARTMRQSRPLISALLRELEKHELVTRERDTTDTRQVLLRLTERGQHVDEYYQLGLIGVLDDAFAHLSKRDTQRLKNAIPALIHLQKQLTTTTRRTRPVPDPRL